MFENEVETAYESLMDTFPGAEVIRPVKANGETEWKIQIESHTFKGSSFKAAVLATREFVSIVRICRAS